ncbi:mRNA 3'-end-processing protein RNA14 [Golovinomyces cichoracearum]|uniref:mRNA 3'-end-processing protein RNA14 n=1 Tax=Golovinomyces cichoracearum TaxID=62708 RepID=A0A420ICA0_9PEZI|nr:mRNA 3'-end-processing protein RNA14 [Golovinomyces cichoracearum]
MAEEDAEIALLHQLQAGQENGCWGERNTNGTTQDEPSNTELNNEQVKKNSNSDDQILRSLSPSGAGVYDDEDGDYDPSSIPTNPAIAVAEHEGSSSCSQASTRKPKTVGGFIADDSDEEYEAALPDIPCADSQPSASNIPNQALPLSPHQSPVFQQHLQASHKTQVETKSEKLPLNVNSVVAGNSPVQASSGLNSIVSQAGVSVPKARLPNDRTGILEDRIKEDTRGDIDAWLALIKEHRNRNKLDEARAVYERFLKVFPQAAEIWVAYIEMELENDNFSAAENIFGRSLLTVPNVALWSVYLNYIRRRNDLMNDVSGTARATVTQSYDFVLANIGNDKDSGKIWHEYIQFIRSAPGVIGGSTWQDQQKMDQLRKAYQRAINVPMSTLNTIWKEYDQFEMSLNKITGRKFLQEKSPNYMSARSANTSLENITRNLNRTTLPQLPPAPGFEGDQEYLKQVEIWQKWIAWEQEDPLVLKNDEPDAYKQRVIYIYKQAAISLRFWPEIWVEAADWCLANNLEKEADLFLNNGQAANPESCLIVFKKADRLEASLAIEEADKTPAERGAIVRAPYDQLFDALYDMIKQLKIREARDLAKLEESSALDASISAIISKAEDEDEEPDSEKQAREAAKETQAKAIQQGYLTQAEILSRTISTAWIALMRAMRRVQGKGNNKDSNGGSRKIFSDARQRGKLTSDVYVAAALIEHHVYKDPAGTKIFERGAKLFPEDADFTLEYLKHLLSIGDTTNARVTFETVVSRLTQRSELVSKAKPLYAYFHKYESQYGELSQISKLEQRMAELFPEDPKLSRFASRYSGENFDPTAVRLIVSPATQMKPKSLLQSIEQPNLVRESSVPQYAQEASPRSQYVQTINSPKRPFPLEDFDSELNRPRKLARGESPLKGAAGRRLDQQRRLQQNQGTPAWQSNSASSIIPRDVNILLSLIPRAEYYTSTKFNPSAMVRLLRETIVPDYNTWKSAREEPLPPSSTQRFLPNRITHPQPPQPSQPSRSNGYPSYPSTIPLQRSIWSQPQTQVSAQAQAQAQAQVPPSLHVFQGQPSHGDYGSYKPNS